MKPITPFLITTLFLLPCACGDDAEASRLRDNVGETLDSIGDYTNKEIEDMSSKLQDSWTDLKVEMAKITAEAKVRGGELGDSIDKALEGAQSRYEAAKQKLEEARKAGGDSAREALAHTEKAFEEAKAAVEKAWKKLGLV